MENHYLGWWTSFFVLTDINFKKLMIIYIKKVLLFYEIRYIITLSTETSIKGGFMCAVKRLSIEERKNEIMQSAARLITEKGFSNMTMEDVIAGTTMSKGGVYHYYKNTLDIFKDLMVAGIDYRDKIIHEHIGECEKGCEVEFMAKQMVDKMLDDNPYMPLYVEFLIEKKRNPKLEEVFEDLKMQANNRFKLMDTSISGSLLNKSTFDLCTNLINAIILASDILGARDNFRENRYLFEEMLISIFKNEREIGDGSI